MQSSLYLTADEQKLFDGLSEALRNGWKSEQESETTPESADKRQARLMLARVRDPKIAAFVDQALQTTDMNAVATLINGLDLHHVDDADMAELFFALGPAALGEIIVSLLRTVKTDDDIRDIASLSLIRHSLLPA